MGRVIRNYTGYIVLEWIKTSIQDKTIRRNEFKEFADQVSEELFASF